MAAGTLNFTIEQGATFKRTLTFQTQDGEAIDLTGNTFAGQLRTSANSENLVAAFAFNLLDQSVAATKGQVEISLTAETTAAIEVPEVTGSSRPSLNCVFDIKRKNSNGDTLREIQGTAIVSAQVTKVAL